MSWLDAIILGLVQGLTEFLPVSSSGHLVLFQGLLGVAVPGVLFETIVHVGTLLSVVIYFRKRLLALLVGLFSADGAAARRYILWLAIGTIPAVIVGLLLKDVFEALFDQPIAAAGFLLVTGAILLATKWAPRRSHNVRAGSAVIMGVGQAMAILPGISRSGSTIAAGLFAGVDAEKAAEFSFLLSIPAILGALVLQLGDLDTSVPVAWGPYLVGGFLAFVSGLLAVYWLLKIVKKGQLHHFSWYCFAVGLIGFVYFW